MIGMLAQTLAGGAVQAEDNLLLCSKGAADALYPLETIRAMTDPCSCVLLPTDCKSKSAWEQFRHVLGLLQELLMKMVISLFSCPLALLKTP